jgi:hypothetical protein
MKLSKEDADLFYRLIWALLFYANQKYPVIKDLKEPNLRNEKSADVLNIHEQLFSHPELIDSFAAENPFSFNQEELDIIKSWKKFVKDRFLIVTHLKNYTIFLTTEKEQKAYGVTGLYDEIQDVIPSFVPQMVNSILLPFRGKITYCGYITSYKIHIGANMRRGIQEDYQKAKSKFGIITSLDEPVVEKKDSDEELLRYYLRSASRRMEHEHEILKILEKNPTLENVYSFEIGRSYAKEAGKRLSLIGVSSAWFAVFEDVVVASGKSEEEARERAYAIVPQDKKAGVYVFRHSKK